MKQVATRYAGQSRDCQLFVPGYAIVENIEIFLVREFFVISIAGNVGLSVVVAVFDFRQIAILPDIFLPFTGLFHTDQTIFRVILVICHIAFGTFGTGDEAVFVQISRVSIRVIRIGGRSGGRNMYNVPTVLERDCPGIAVSFVAAFFFPFRYSVLIVVSQFYITVRLVGVLFRVGLHFRNQQSSRYGRFVAVVGNLSLLGRTLLLDGNRDFRSAALDHDRSPAVLTRRIHFERDRNRVVACRIAVVRGDGHPRRAFGYVGAGLGDRGAPRTRRRERDALGGRARGLVGENRVVFRRAGGQLNVLTFLAAIIVRTGNKGDCAHQ